MKYILLLFLLFGCNKIDEQFDVGTCFYLKDHADVILKVIEKGKISYLTTFWTRPSVRLFLNFNVVNELKNNNEIFTIDCPDTFKNMKVK